jgi:large subunit ribosomal protein L21e
VRIEHVQPSRCREDFLRRRETNDAVKHEAKVKGEKPPTLKRAVKGPRDGFTLTDVAMETMTAIPYDIIKEGIM